MGSFRHLLTTPVQMIQGKKKKVQIKKLELFTKSIDNTMKTIA